MDEWTIAYWMNIGQQGNLVGNEMAGFAKNNCYIALERERQKNELDRERNTIEAEKERYRIELELLHETKLIEIEEAKKQSDEARDQRVYERDMENEREKYEFESKSLVV